MWRAAVIADVGGARRRSKRLASTSAALLRWLLGADRFGLAAPVRAVHRIWPAGAHRLSSQFGIVGDDTMNRQAEAFVALSSGSGTRAATSLARLGPSGHRNRGPPRAARIPMVCRGFGTPDLERQRCCSKRSMRSRLRLGSRDFVGSEGFGPKALALQVSAYERSRTGCSRVGRQRHGSGPYCSRDGILPGTAGVSDGRHRDHSSDRFRPLSGRRSWRDRNLGFLTNVNYITHLDRFIELFWRAGGSAVHLRNAGS
jgi:hypothetical protein